MKPAEGVRSLAAALCEDLTNPDSPAIREAKTRTCDICQAPKGRLCTNTIVAGQPLPGRAVHYGRLVDRRREPKEDT